MIIENSNQMKTLLKIVFLFLLHISFYLNADAQKPITWQKIFGLDSLVLGKCGIQTSDGGYAILGSWDPISAYPHWTRVLKLDKFGNLVWTRNYRVATYYSMIEDSDSGFVLIGYGGIGNGAALFKINSNGDSILYKTYGGLSIIDFRKIKKYYDGGFILTGRDRNGLGYIERLDSNYNSIWANTYSSINYESLYTRDIAFDKNNNIAISLIGYISQISDGGLLKLTPDGNQYLMKFDVTPLVSDNYNGILPINGKYAVSGGADFPSDSVSSIYCLLDTNGNLILRKYYYHSASYYSRFPFLTYASGNYFVLGGYSYEIKGHRKMGLRKIDYSGNIIWTRVINDALSISTPANINWTLDNGYLLTGNYENVPADAYCIYVIKTDSNAFAEPVGISNQFVQTPNKFILHSVFPNPFNGSSKIRYEIMQYDNYKMEIFNVNGKSIALVFDEKLNPGIYEKSLGSYFTDLSSSIYFISLENDKQVLTRKLLFLK